MRGSIKTKTFLGIFVSVLTLAFTGSGLCMEQPDTARILPTGKVYLYKGEQKVGYITREAPLPEGVLLVCDGKCAVTMNKLYLAGLDKSRFSVNSDEGSKRLALREGRVYFALSTLPEALVFETPHGLITTQQVMVNASAQGVLKGYVQVQGSSTELGVLEGGSMVVSTARGKKTIKPGQRLLLTQADVGEEDDSGGVAAGGTKLSTAQIVGGISAGVVIAGAAVWAIDEASEDDHEEVSPY